MSSSAQRYIGGLLGFASAAIWVTVGLESALICIVGAGLGYAAVRFAEPNRLGGILAARGALRRELQKRATAAQPRARRPSTRPTQTRPRTRRPIVEPRTGETATYGW